jgi:hypothetical protein
LFIANLTFETIADHQQQRFQNEKHSAEAAKSPRLERGFVTDGLWAWSRHPNFACEQCPFFFVSLGLGKSAPAGTDRSFFPWGEAVGWYILYLFALRATVPASVVRALWNALHANDWHLLVGAARQAWPHFINYSIIGAVAMSALFEASTWFTEDISSSKYPTYKQCESPLVISPPRPVNVLLSPDGGTGRT